MADSVAPTCLKVLGRLVRQERRRRGLTLRDAAALAGVPFTTLARVECGHNTPDALNFLLICAWLDIPPGWFAGDPDDGRAACRCGRAEMGDPR
jgi:transcriptional regulator with XRE-family HTH domain